MVQDFELELDKIHLHSQAIKYTTIGGKARSFPVKEYIEFKKMVAEEIKKQIDESIDLEATCSMQLTFVYQIPKSYSKNKKIELQNSFKPSSPDIDNLSKSMLDSFSGVLYNDDKQIVSLSAIKTYGIISQEAPIIVYVHINYLK